MEQTNVQSLAEKMILGGLPTDTTGMDEDEIEMLEVLKSAALAQMPAFMEGQAEIYDKTISEESINALVAFYETPEGKEILAAAPIIMKEAEVLGRKMHERIMQIMIDKGYMPPQD